jgi:hypothetical protein
MIPFAVPMGAGSSAISFVAAGVAGSGTDTGALPVGWSPGQVAIFVIASYNAALTIPSHALPAGWTLIGSATEAYEQDGSEQAVRISVYRRRLVALDTDPQATATNAITSGTGIITYSGVHASTPTEGATTLNSASAGGTISAAYLTITTTGPNRMLVQALAHDGTSAGTPGFYWTERLDASGGFGLRFRADDRRVYASGTHPPVTSPSASGAALVRANVAFALIPA